MKVKFKTQKLDYDGRGLSYDNKKVVFIRGALQEEEVEAKLIHSSKHFDEYQLTNIIQPNPKRRASFCPYSASCGGFTFDIVSYEDSLNFKKEILQDLVNQNKLDIEDISIVPSPKELGYRNKVSLKIEQGQVGYYEEKTHTFLPIQNCLLARKEIQEFLKDFSMLHIENGSITIRVNTNGELLLLIESPTEPKIEEKLVETHKIAGIIYNGKCVYNSPYFFERLGHILYKVDGTSFFQVNTDISEKIKTDITSYFNRNDIVYDFYCGVGYFSLHLAHKTKQVIGIEANQKAILNAIYNASLNQIENTSFHAGKVEDLIDKIPVKANKAIVDPPRSGLHKKVRDVFLSHDFDTIIYISCNPKTLVRDLKELTKKYKIDKLTAYDMFPYTKHIECVCILKNRKKRDSYDKV